MTPEERELLTTSIKLSEENNKILRGMRRSARFSSFLRIIYWLLILVSIFTAYSFIQPYIETVINGYNDIQEGVENVKNVTSKLPTLPGWLGGKK